MIKSMMMRKTEHGACMGKREIYTTCWSRNRKGKSHERDKVEDDRIILQWMCNGSIYDQIEGFFEHSNKLSGS